MKKLVTLVLLALVIALALKVREANQEFDYQVRVAKVVTSDPCITQVLRVITPRRFSTRSQVVILAGEDYLSKSDPNLWMIYGDGARLWFCIVAFRTMIFTTADHE
jgi:hypothetical protein